MTAPSLKYTLYRDMILMIKQNKTKGKVNSAKPTYILCLIEGIEKGIIVNNQIYYDDVYALFKEKYSGKETMPHFPYPFFYLQSDGFYNLQWKVKPEKYKFPTMTFIRENLDFAYLDNALWDLLQDAEIRHLYKTLIIENFFSNKENK